MLLGDLPAIIERFLGSLIGEVINGIEAVVSPSGTSTENPNIIRPAALGVLHICQLFK